VSFLAHHQDDVSARFATSGIDRFADGGWSRLESGEPVIDGALSWVRGRVVQRTPVGDSYLVSLRALASSAGPGGGDRRPGESGAPSPLVYHDRTYHRIGDHSVL
jgi:flavin reductase (DIM6/NTAB) family NADH-FMN oxidoreductase RutF